MFFSGQIRTFTPTKRAEEPLAPEGDNPEHSNPLVTPKKKEDEEDRTNERSFDPKIFTNLESIGNGVMIV